MSCLGIWDERGSKLEEKKKKQELERKKQLFKYFPLCVSHSLLGIWSGGDDDDDRIGSIYEYFHMCQILVYTLCRGP